ncbi:hypothetical protein B0H10DRAFT_1952743 [Mycena sp. CBHHK59/15]|nr:hypothetical protein B0H10DRAFT_1952743 [Mycena sp. CBHHK59/15]
MSNSKWGARVRLEPTPKPSNSDTGRFASHSRAPRCSAVDAHAGLAMDIPGLSEMCKPGSKLRCALFPSVVKVQFGSVQSGSGSNRFPEPDLDNTIIPAHAQRGIKALPVQAELPCLAHGCLIAGQHAHVLLAVPPGSCYCGNGHNGLDPGGKYEMHAKPTPNHVPTRCKLSRSRSTSASLWVPAAFTLSGMEAEVDVNANINADADTDVELENAARWELL